VLVSSTGQRLLEPDGVAAYVDALLPWAQVATPNLREAAVLGGVDLASLVESHEARVAVAERLRRYGPRWVVVKGGHLADSAVDVVAGPDGVTLLPGIRSAEYRWRGRRAYRRGGGRDRFPCCRCP
jgi:hydroxymethylpyrimidine/phosphomethylpyrimidine kinase